MLSFNNYIYEADAGSDTKNGAKFNELTGKVENDPKKDELKKALDAIKEYPPEVRAQLEKQIRQAYEEQSKSQFSLSPAVFLPTKPNSNVVDVDKLTKEQKQELLRLEREVNPKAAGPIRFQSTFDPRFHDNQQMIFDPNSPEYRAYRADLAKLGMLENEDEKAAALAADPDVSELEKFMKASQEAALGILAARAALNTRRPGSVLRFNVPSGTPLNLQSMAQPRVGQLSFGQVPKEQQVQRAREIISQSLDTQTPPSDPRTRPEQPKDRTTPTTPPTSGAGTAHRKPSEPDLGPPSGGGAGGGGGGTTTRAPTRPLKIISTTPAKSTVKFPAFKIGLELLPFVGIPPGPVAQQKPPEPGDVIIAPPAPPEIKPEEIPSIPGTMPPEIEPDERKKPQPIAPPAPATPPSKPSAPPEEKPVPQPTKPATEPGKKPDEKPVPGPTKPATEPGEQPSTPPVPAPKPEPPVVPKPEKPAPTDKPSTGTAAGTGEKPKETPKDQGTPKKEPQPPFTPDPVKPTLPTTPSPSPPAPPSPKKPLVVAPPPFTGETGGVGPQEKDIGGGGRSQMFVSGLAGGVDAKSASIVTKFTYEELDPENLIQNARLMLINEAILENSLIRQIKLSKFLSETN